jgi:DNA invertase Pin-like site-specific DNA recombinase
MERPDAAGRGLGRWPDRPALQRLLEDLRAGKVDVIVVYKVDRLTRSLADFAKLVELFDQHSVSFVSVTQQFNTTTSMGRLTLNVLLSFAQFEREVTSERIRDKISASKRKGLWVGGMAPLGYDTKDRKIAVNEAEADRVRTRLGGLAAQRGKVILLPRKQKAPHTKQGQVVSATNRGNASSLPPASRQSQAAKKKPRACNRGSRLDGTLPFEASSPTRP